MPEEAVHCLLTVDPDLPTNHAWAMVMRGFRRAAPPFGPDYEQACLSLLPQGHTTVVKGSTFVAGLLSSGALRYHSSLQSSVLLHDVFEAAGTWTGTHAGPIVKEVGTLPWRHDA